MAEAILTEKKAREDTEEALLRMMEDRGHAVVQQSCNGRIIFF